MSVELHLPDLPEVPLAVGRDPARPRARLPWHQRLIEGLTTYLPLLMMTVLALGTWWLVKRTPGPPPARESEQVRKEPDYTMQRFEVLRFDAAGRLKLRIRGEQMRHFPDTDRIEIEDARIQAYAPSGTETLAYARKALANGDGSEVQLLGGAQVDSTTADGIPLRLSGEFLHAFITQERVRSHLPVLVEHGRGNRIQAEGLEFDHLQRVLQLKGRMRAVFEPATPAPQRSSRP